MKARPKTAAQAKAEPPIAATIVAGAKIREEDIPDGGPPPELGDPPPLKSFIEIVRRKFCTDVQPDAPAWAKRAAERVVASVLPPRRKKEINDLYDFGYTAGQLSAAGELLPSGLPSTKGLNDFERE